MDAQNAIDISKIRWPDPVGMGDPDRMDHRSNFLSPVLKECDELRKTGPRIDRLPCKGLQQAWVIGPVLENLGR